MTVLIRREKHKGRYYVIQRENGRIKGMKRWSQKSNLSTSIKNYNRTGSIREDQKTIKLGAMRPGVNYEEVVLIGNKSRKPRKPYQYYMIVKANNVTAEGRSMQRPADYPKKLAREEAMENAVGRTAGKLNFTDTDLGAEIIESGEFKIIDEGIVYYRKI